MRAPLFRYITPRGSSRVASVLVALVSLSAGAPSAAWGKPKPAAAKNATLRKRLGAEKVPIEGAESLAKVTARLKELRGGTGVLRVLHLGDSHVASDYITGTIRERLQAVLGDAGRGFVAPDQQEGYGGRRLERSQTAWEADRIVDTGREGLPFGFSGASLESRSGKARVSYLLLGGETKLGIYYQAQPEGGQLDVLVDGAKVGQVDTKAAERASLVHQLELEKPKKSQPKRKLELVAKGPKVRLYGVSFERPATGVLYDTIGPVGADAKVYLDLDRKSFTEHLTAHAPDLVVLMVGGNDAMKIRKGWTDLAKVRRDHEQLLDVVKTALPRAECLVWSPMDAGDRQGKKIVSKGFLKEVRDMQREVARAKGCAFWDLYTSMGGEGSISKWVAARVINEDLVHPREKAAEVLGELFAEPFLDLAPE